MKLGQLTISVFLLFFSAAVYSQSEIETLVQEGIQLHDNRNYDQAIIVYQKALKIDPASTLVNYEIALSYIEKGENELAIKYADIVLKQKADYLLPAYIAKGSALDNLGKTKESIEVFEKAAEETEGHYLLFYNLAFNYFGIEDLEKAEINVIKALEFNSSHPTSHLLLANIHDKKGNPVQAILSSYYFLLLEPNSSRSPDAYSIIQNNYGKNVSKDSEDPNSINIFLDTESEFATAELTLSIIAASSIENEKDLSEQELFAANTDTFFKVLGETNDEDKTDIWRSLYAPFFYNLAQSGHLKTYCGYISQNSDESFHTWLQENKTEVIAFDNWLRNK